MRAFWQKRAGKSAVLLALIFAAVLLAGGTAWAQLTNPDAPGPLVKEQRLFEPIGIDAYLNSTNPAGIPGARAAAIALGKALLWDVQVGSDGQTACASCHSRAGADHRTINTLHPGANGSFNVKGVNSALDGLDFPFHDRADPLFQSSKVIRDADDAVGSQGIRLAQFAGIDPGKAEELFTPLTDPVFSDGAGHNVRQLTRRNTPTYINAAFNFTAFHDGRANNVFNGVNNWGPADPDAAVYVDNNGTLAKEKVRIRHAALASQAVAPPLSTVEMSYVGRTFPHIGKKLLQNGIMPLGKQTVAPDDSVFGSGDFSSLYTYKNSLGNVVPIPLGLGIVDDNGKLTKGYRELIEAAFNPRFWSNTKPISINGEEFTQMEANFSLFFGLAVQLYEMTLISDDTRFDRYQKGLETFSIQEERGLELFLLSGCGACHGGPEFTAHTHVAVQVPSVSPPTATNNPFAAIGVERQVKFGNSFVDEGIYNIGVRPTTEDIGRGGRTPANFDTRPTKQRVSKDGSFPLSFTELALLNKAGKLPPDNGDHTALVEFVPDLPAGSKDVKRADMVKGAFKMPTLRNIGLTGPFFHNGSVGTLSQVMDFYTRGGNFPKANEKNLHPAIVQLFDLQQGVGALPPEALHESMVDFLLTLTDDRVKFEKAPFDHPSIHVPQGVDPLTGDDFETISIPAVGAGGRSENDPLVGFGEAGNPFGEMGLFQ